MGGPLYDLETLTRLAGVTRRTVHYYIQQGLLPPAGVSGPGPKYDRRHLLRLKLIRRLRDEHLPLAEINLRLKQVTDEDLERLFAGLAAETSPDPAAPPHIVSRGNQPVRENALDYIHRVLERSGSPPADPAWMAESLRRTARQIQSPVGWDKSQWERIVLTPDVEIHIRRPSRLSRKAIDRLLGEARKILGEEPL